MQRRCAIVVGLACVVGLLAGCATIPTSGAVQKGNDQVDANEPLSYLAPDPRPGDDPSAMVEGFLQAMAAGQDDDFVTARKFLTSAAAQNWQPGERVSIYSTQNPPRRSSPEQGVIRVSVDLVAQVDSDGRYSAAQSSTPQVEEYRLVQGKDHQWRIDALPNDLLISDAVFAAQYRQVALYFPSLDSKTMVPELRWYPRRNAPTSVVGALLAGPSSWLRDAVRNPVPVGTRLRVDSVPNVQGVAEVDLTSEALAASPSDRALMVAQIRSSLLQLPDLSDVRIMVEGQDFDLPSTVPNLAIDPEAALGVTYIQGTQLMVFDGATSQAWPAIDLSGLNPSHPAISTDGREAVVLSGADDLVRVASTHGSTGPIARGVDLVAPSYDRFGWVWTGSAKPGAHLIAVSPQGEQVSIRIDWLAGRTLQSLRVARDGTRIAVVSADSGGTTVDVAAIVRDSAGQPASVGPALQIGALTTVGATVAWTDEGTVAVLGTNKAGTATPYLIAVGGLTDVLNPVDGAQSITAGRGSRQVYVGTDSVIYQRKGPSWTEVANGRDPAFRG